MITLTPNATDQLKQLIEKQADPSTGLRVFVSGSGKRLLQPS